MNFEDVQNFLPPNLRQAVSGYIWRQNNIGLSSAQVFCLEAKDKNSLYLKIDFRVSKHSLLQEKLKLDWLKNRLPVAEVLLFAEDETNEYPLLSEISGVDASDDSLKNHIPRTIEQLANGLKMIHSLPIEDCPFDARLACKIEIARERTINGLVEENDFDEERQGRTAEDLFEELLATVPPDEDLVFTHGDYCVPNVIIENGNLSGFVDWESAGVADRYQ
ncbi:MAG: aminoglycoside 3'-phosphotransferase, partial [Acidobacteriota bacterium]|nr:aminoglycoside 3'-phosphotransferase [Acidobacteriota bacterium]